MVRRTSLFSQQTMVFIWCCTQHRKNSSKIPKSIPDKIKEISYQELQLELLRGHSHTDMDTEKKMTIYQWYNLKDQTLRGIPTCNLCMLLKFLVQMYLCAQHMFSAHPLKVRPLLLSVSACLMDSTRFKWGNLCSFPSEHRVSLLFFSLRSNHRVVGISMTDKYLLLLPDYFFTHFLLILFIHGNLGFPAEKKNNSKYGNKYTSSPKSKQNFKTT